MASGGNELNDWENSIDCEIGFFRMQEETTGEPEKPKSLEGKVSQVLLTVKPSGTSYGSFTNSVTGSDVSSLTSIDEIEQQDFHDNGRHDF